ncbi:MAG: zinc metallopeptidase [Planctomycetes bacterium]|nr:zinc metallopeptidase [Planctomycetota bacterium]
MFFYFDWTWWLMIPAILIALYAQIRVKTTYAKYAQRTASSGINATDAARQILDQAGLADVPIEHVPGNLTDHYDPRERVLRLSDTVYNSRSLAALGVAAHEAGHAIQHQQSYTPLVFRNGIAPVVAFGQHLWYIILLGSIFMMSTYRGWPVWMLDVGIIVMTGVVVFQVVTLPVEFNASKRALVLLKTNGIVLESEISDARAVLNAAAFTYVAATLSSILMLLRLILIRRSQD